jgi:hypothetical protein
MNMIGSDWGNKKGEKGREKWGSNSYFSESVIYYI